MSGNRRTKKHLENLLEWCNDIYSSWESVKPRFLKQFDLRSLEEWEESYHELKGKIQADLKEDLDHYQRAKDLLISWIDYLKSHMLFKNKLN